MTDDAISELARLRDRAVHVANSDAEWETKYDLIFSDDMSLMVMDLDPGFSYYDPDTSYEDDVRAFVDALQERVTELEKAIFGTC